MLNDKIVIAKICNADYRGDETIDGARVAWTLEDMQNIYNFGVKPYERDHSVWNAYINGASC